MNNILLKAQSEHNLSKLEIINLLESDGIELFKVSDIVRKKYVGDEIHLRGLIEFSNICKSSCKYCGLRFQNKNIERYRLSDDEIVNFAKTGYKLGYKTIVLQSGEDSYFNLERLLPIIRRIKENDIALTLSIGELSTDEYKKLKEAGADRYLLRIETTDRELYKFLHPNMSFDNRLRCLRDLKNFGYEVGTGCLVGLPNQTIKSLADDILFFKEINADMIGIGPFIPHPDTPLMTDLNKENFNMALKVMAIVRLLLPDINIPATTAMETINPNGRILALKSGANVIMPNIMTKEYKQKYQIYPDKAGVNNEVSENRKDAIDMILSIGRKVSQDKGFRSSL